jgi:hypothetical protein
MSFLTTTLGSALGKVTATITSARQTARTINADNVLSHISGLDEIADEVFAGFNLSAYGERADFVKRAVTLFAGETIRLEMPARPDVVVICKEGETTLVKAAADTDDQITHIPPHFVVSNAVVNQEDADLIMHLLMDLIRERAGKTASVTFFSLQGHAIKKLQDMTQGPKNDGHDAVLK